MKIILISTLGDAGLDLFVVDDQVIPGNSTQPIHIAGCL